jgi:hypothetical protein
MNSPEANRDRLDTYILSIESMIRKSKAPPHLEYTLANLALEELKIATERAEEPSEEAFQHVADRFDAASISAKGLLTAYRSKVLKAWIRPIVWSDIINLGTLSSGEAKRVARNIGLRDAADQTAVVARDALAEYDNIRPDTARHTELKGFLSETTPLLLHARHTTAKSFSVPTTLFDDEINPAKALHVDAVYFDNRKQRQRKNIPYQIETLSGWHYHTHRSIPIIGARVLGNLEKASQWPTDDRPFMTLRHLIEEKIGIGVDANTSSQLDRINTRVTAKLLETK